jgi:DNA-binding NarL/FixJ family response regulator
MFTDIPQLSEPLAESKRITLLIADDHQLFIDGIALILNEQPNISIVDQALNGQEVIEALGRHSIDIVLLDINMPNTKISNVINEIRKISPLTRIIILTMDVSLANYLKLLKNGINGFILKTEDKTQIIEAINAVSSGGKYVSKKVFESLSAIKKTLPPTSPRIEDILTSSEIRVIKLFIKGYSSSKVADTLFIAKGTVDTHLKNIKAKLGVSNKTELVITCLQYELLQL